MAFLLAHLEIDDYDTWKRDQFDKDPAGRRGLAKGHQIFRAVEDRSQMFVGVGFESANDATTLGERLVASGVLERMDVRTQPTVVEVADAAEY
jgi:hypothetical protein